MRKLHVIIIVVVVIVAVVIVVIVVVVVVVASSSADDKSRKQQRTAFFRFPDNIFAFPARPQMFAQVRWLRGLKHRRGMNLGD